MSLLLQFRRHQAPPAAEEAVAELAEAEAEERPCGLRAGAPSDRTQEFAGEASSDDPPRLRGWRGAPQSLVLAEEVESLRYLGAVAVARQNVIGKWEPSVTGSLVRHSVVGYGCSEGGRRWWARVLQIGLRGRVERSLRVLHVWYRCYAGCRV